MKNTHKLFFLPLLALTLTIGCKKSKQTPCGDSANEPAPTQIALIYMDGQTGENILISKNIDNGAITVSPETSGTIIKNSNSDMYGAFRFAVEDLKKGDYQYTVSIPDVATTTLSYTNTEVAADNPCKATTIKVQDPVVAEHAYTITRSGTNIIIKITL